MNKKYSARLLSQIVFTILLITVCAGSVLATDITVSAAQYPGFNPSGLPADVSGSNASVTNNSTTVTLTVANGFRPSWNGLKGFRIALGGVDYTVSSTTYNSSTQTGTFTLGNAYAASTGTVSWKVYTFVLLRVYANKDFTVSDGSYIVSGSTPGSGAFYQQYACSVINGTLYVPTVVLPSTTDAYVVAQRNAKYTMNLYRPDGNSLIQTFQCMGNVFIPASPTTTTWGDLCQTNTTSTTVVQNLNTLTTTEIESRLNNFYSSALGTTGRIQKKISSNSLGDSILSESAATVTANGNLTVTTNQSVGGTQSVSGAASFGSTVTLSADPATSLEASTKKFADFNGAEIRAYQYATLGAAVTAIGSSTKVLQIGEPLTCNSSVIIPSTLTLRFTGSGMITYALGCSITFAGAGVEAGMNRQIFSGFTANASSPPIKWSTTYPDQISFKWFGGSTSATGAENSNAWRLMFDAMAAPIGDGSSPSVVQQGALVYVPPSTSACYAFDDTAQITKPVNLRGGASAGWYRNTCLSFPKGKTGLYVNGVNTWLSPYSSGPVFAGFANLENITVIGGGYKHDAPTSAVDMSVDTTSGSLVITRNASDTTHTFGQDVARDVTVVVNRYVYAVDSKDSTTQITIKKPRFFVQATPGSSAVRMVSGYAPHTLSGATITETSDWNGQQIEIDSKMYAISSITHDATFNESIINLTTNYSGTTNTSGTDCINNETPCHRGTATVQSLNTMSGQNLWINNAHGIDSKAQITLRNFHVRYFAGNGVQLTTATMPLGAATCAGCVNQNNSYIARGMIYNTAGHGLVVAGLETNSIEINSVDVSVVKGACFLLASFLGSVYSTTHCAEAEFGAFYNPISPAPGSNRIKNAYVESGTPSSLLGQGDRMDETGGSVDPSGVGVATNTSSSLFNTTNLQIKRDYPYHNPGTLIRLGFVGNNGATASTPSTVPILMLGNTDDPNNTAAGGNSREAAPTTWLHYYPTGTVFPGWYGLTYTGAVNKAAFLLSTGAATIAGTHTGNDAGGYVMFPRGFFLSDLSNGTPSQGRRYAMNSAAPTSGTWIGGDFVFNQTTSLGGNLGWTATAGGTPGTWSKAGWIYSSVSGSGTQQLGATITTPSSGQVLQWDGSKWINSASAGALLGANQTFTGNQSITGTLTLGASGSAIALQKKASASLDFDLSATACQDLTIALTGATTGDTVGLGIPVGSVTTDTFFNAYVSAADTVTVRACRLSGTPNPSAGTFTVWLTK